MYSAFWVSNVLARCTPNALCLDSVKKGNLWKKSKKKWNQKFFLLEGTNLLYYNTASDYHKNKAAPKRVIELVYVDRVSAMLPCKHSSGVL